MSSSVVIKPEDALRLISEAPDAAEKTPADLREAAEEFERDAERKDRVAAGAKGNRAKARAKSRERRGDRLRLHAQVCRSAAAEIEARDCPNVGEASKSAVVRAMRKALRLHARGGAPRPSPGVDRSTPSQLTPFQDIKENGGAFQHVPVEGDGPIQRRLRGKA